MANQYSNPSITGYNSNAPSDDAAETTTNQLKWEYHIDKIGDPIKNLAAAMGNAVDSAFDANFFQGNTAVSTTYTVALTDRGNLISCTSTFTLTMLAAGAATSGFMVTIYNKGSGTITVDGNDAETINGEATISLIPNDWAILRSDGSNWLGIRGTEPLDELQYLSGLTENVQDGLDATWSGDIDPLFQSYGDGLDGAITISADADLDYSVVNATTYTINATRTITCKRDFTIIKATTSIDLQGSINFSHSDRDNLGLYLDKGTTSDDRTATSSAGGGGGGGSYQTYGTGTTAESDGTASHSTAIAVAGAGGAHGQTAAGSVGGTGATPSAAKQGNIATLATIMIGQQPSDGGNGGDGGTNGIANPGVGGASAGVLVLMAPTITLGASCILTATGENGTNGGNGDANNDGGDGGGGGGHGGTVVLVSPSITDSSTKTLTAGTGGTGGTGNSGGYDGGAGGDGAAGFTLTIDPTA